jgi:hypothetical protein
MPTQTKSTPIIEARYGEAVYSPKTIERWRRESEETKAQYARGEIKPMSVAEFAALHGIEFTDE